MIKQDISKAKEILVMSERGYSKLIKAMDDYKSWDVMDKFIDEYFIMRDTVNLIAENHAVKKLRGHTERKYICVLFNDF